MPPASADPPPLIRRLLARLGLLFVACTLLGVYFAGASYADYSYRDYDVAWSDLLVRSLVDWWTWVLLGPLVLLLAAFPGERRTWPITLLVHLPAGIVCGVVKTIIQVAAVNMIFDTDVGIGIGRLAAAVPVYWAIVAVVRGLDARQRARARRLRLSRLESQLARVQLEALRTQLRPHFLFNTLHAIATLMRRDVDAAERMIARLGDLLRLTLEREGAHVVTLKQELELLGRYLDIETIRFGDRLTVTIEADAAMLDVMVPNLVLQPLVENAVHHGISARSGPGHILVRATPDGDGMVLEVRDDGPGLPADRPLVPGVGLGNTRARLEQLYGDAASFSIDNATPHGAVVRIRIPRDAPPPEPPPA